MVPVSRLALGDIVALVERLDVPFRDQWVRELRWGSLDTYVALLLALAPNLKRLRLNESFFRNSRFVDMYIRSVMCEEPTQQEASSARPRPLSNLTEVSARLTYQGKARTGSSNTSDILTVFYSRTIRHISASIDNPVTFPGPGEAPPAPTNLTSLELTVLREGHLGRLLSVTKNLRKLKWEWLLTSQAKRPGVKDIVDLAQIAADLSHPDRPDDLADIDDNLRNYDMELLEFRGSFEALASFDALKSLEVPFPFLTATFTDEVTYPIQRSLPGTLRTLQITDDLLQQLDYDEGNHYPFQAIFEASLTWRKGNMVRLNPLDYRIALIAVLEIEAQAALLMLDHTHEGEFPLHRGDDYVFHAGDINGRNVVVATFPAGSNYGTGAAASLASQTKSYFRNLWFGLLVGVAAGLPNHSKTPAVDIRLGDVLVALPKGESAGLISYDLGKTTDDKFELLDGGRVLAKTEQVVRSAIGAIKVRAPNDRKLFLPFYEAIQDEEHSFEFSDDQTFRDPGQDEDKLYVTGSDGAEMLLQRDRRHDDKRTRVWYGPIGSGDKLMKSSVERDKYRDLYNIIGLEMEAAGVMSSLPVGVVRGVCDYGDKHKNKKWQPYAAAMAASYAKAILMKIGQGDEAQVAHGSL
ncbi:hypothetical protein LQW54_010002 [Pestalotiopsis sp. IQ-011]